MSPVSRIVAIVVIVIIVLVVVGAIMKARDEMDSRESRSRVRPTKGGTWGRERSRSPRDSKCRSCDRSPDVRRTVHDSGVSLGSSESCDDRSPQRQSIRRGPRARIPPSRSCERSRRNSSSSSSSSDSSSSDESRSRD